MRLYRPTERQEAFHSCRASERLVIGGNRSGKSLCTFVEDARAATAQDPHGKYPATDGIIAIIGKDWTHIGVTVYPMLFKSGAFKIIRDSVTNEWRAFDPVRDKGRESERRPAPPLIPPRYIKHKAWIQKSTQAIKRVDLVNGWTIHFFSSEGDPPQGFQADIVHFDEDLSNEDFVGEMQARLADRKGRLFWSAMPHSKNDALIGMAERAEKAEEVGIDNPDIRLFRLPFTANPHIDDEEKRKMLERWAAQGADVLRMRSDGEFSTDSILVYPSWNPSIHVLDPAFSSLLPHGVVPDHWCRFAAVDPGHAVCAALFMAIPPDDSMWLIYDELYLRDCNAVKFGDAFAEKIKNSFRTFILDMHGGRLTDIGSGVPVAQQYVDQLRAHDVKSETTGHSFLAGCDDVQSRLTAARTALHIRGDGSTKLKVLKNTCPNLLREIRRYKKKIHTVNGTSIVSDEPNTRGEVHAVQCMEYLVAHQPHYHRPKAPPTPEPWYVDWMKKRQRKASRFVYLGPQSGMTSEN